MLWEGCVSKPAEIFVFLSATLDGGFAGVAFGFICLCAGIRVFVFVFLRCPS
jgi:hypothetical protein